MTVVYSVCNGSVHGYTPWGRLLVSGGETGTSRQASGKHLLTTTKRCTNVSTRAYTHEMEKEPGTGRFMDLSSQREPRQVRMTTITHTATVGAQVLRVFLFPRRLLPCEHLSASPLMSPGSCCSPILAYVGLMALIYMLYA